MADNSFLLTHPWQECGLGRAPFRYAGMVVMPFPDAYGSNVFAYNEAMRSANYDAKLLGISGLGSCDVCGTGIHNHFVIRDADGKRFKVGCDCVLKTNDESIIKPVQAAERQRAKAISDRKHKLEAEYRNEKKQKEREDNESRAKGVLDRIGCEAAWAIYAESKLDDKPAWEEGNVTKLVEGLIRYGSLSEKQMLFLADLLSKIENRIGGTATPAPGAKLMPTGRVVIRGMVVCVKEQDSYFGPQTKVLILTEDGFKLWGSQFAMLNPAYNGEDHEPEMVYAKKGDQVEFKATIEPSKTDPVFGFFKRPHVSKPSKTSKPRKK